LRREQIGYLHHAITSLPDRLQLVVTEYFLNERPMADIAADLGVTESRVSQLRAEALSLLKDGLNTHLDPDLAAAPENPDGITARPPRLVLLHHRQQHVAAQPPLPNQRPRPTTGPRSLTTPRWFVPLERTSGTPTTFLPAPKASAACHWHANDVLPARIASVACHWSAPVAHQRRSCRRQKRP